MSTVSTLTAVCLLTLPTACEESAEQLNWSSFDAEVLAIARDVLWERFEERHGERPPPAVDAFGPITATREDVLKAILVINEEGGQIKGRQAHEAIVNLGAEALEPLIAILNDEAVDRRPKSTAVYFLSPPGLERQSEPGRIWSTLQPELANRIVDAVIGYARQYPGDRSDLDRLAKITPLERIPELLSLIESSSGNAQRTYIKWFCTMTNTRFPTIPEWFCGNEDPESVKQAIAEGEKRQQAGVADIKAWWAEHKNESPDEWQATFLRRHIDDHIQRLDQLFQAYADEGTRVDRSDLDAVIYAPPHEGIWRSSALGVLLEEYNRVPDYVQPYVLRLIGSTGHPDAAAFVTGRLPSKNPDLQRAAIAALKDLRASDRVAGIAVVLAFSDDEFVLNEAIDALEELAGPKAFDYLAGALGHSTPSVVGSAAQALKPYLVSHAGQLRRIAQVHPNGNVRIKLSALLDGAAATAVDSAKAEPSSYPEKVEAVRALLRSDIPERHRQGLHIATGSAERQSGQESPGYPELMPEVLALFTSTKPGTPSGEPRWIIKTGIPNLTVQNAPELMGRSNALDRNIAAFCYAKYGREALPIVEQAAFNLRDDRYPNRAPGKPAVGLIRVLLREQLPRIQESVIRLVKDSRTDVSYVRLLAMMDDPASAALPGELLHHEDESHRIAATWIIGLRRLQQHADALFEIASSERLDEQHAATLALMELGDARAWQAVRLCLEGEYLDRHKRHGMEYLGPGLAIQFGFQFAGLKATHREAIQALLGDELSGPFRERVIAAFTGALCHNPQAEDADLLWSVAGNASVHDTIRVYAAAALSKLEQRRVIPVIHSLIRTFIDPDPDRSLPAFNLFGPSAGVSPAQQRQLLHPPESLLDDSYRPPASLPKHERHNYDLGLALRRLGDETLESELTVALTNNRGEFNVVPFALLGGMVGARALDYARTWAEAHSRSPDDLGWYAAILLNLDIASDKLVPHMLAGSRLSTTSLHELLGRDDPQTADVLVKAYHELTGRDKRFQTDILDALCRFGDQRGLALALDNPLLFASVVKYVPEADPVDFPAGHFEYNRIEEAMRVQAWYRQHADVLKWDADSGTFRSVQSSE